MYSTNIYWVLLRVKPILDTEDTMVSKTKRFCICSWNLQKVDESNNEKQRRWSTTVQWYHPESAVCMEVRCSDSLSTRRVLASSGMHGQETTVHTPAVSNCRLCLSCCELPHPRSLLYRGLRLVREQSGGNEVGPFQPKGDHSNGQYSFQSILPDGLRISRAYTVIWFLPLVIMFPPLVFPWSRPLINKLHTNLHLSICF